MSKNVDSNTGVKYQSLEGKLLIASPNLSDVYFEQSLIYICAHDETGAIGIMINHKIGTTTLGEFFDTYKNIYKKSSKFTLEKHCRKNLHLLFGGPVNSEMIIAMSMTKEQKSDFEQKHKISLHIDVLGFLQDIALKKIKPIEILLSRGITAWEQNQLEKEILENSWFVTDPSAEIIFTQKIKPQNKWQYMMEKIGIDDKQHTVVQYSGNA